MGLTNAIIRFAIWPDLPKTQPLNHTYKTHLMVIPWLLQLCIYSGKMSVTIIPIGSASMHVYTIQ